MIIAAKVITTWWVLWVPIVILFWAAIIAVLVRASRRGKK